MRTSPARRYLSALVLAVAAVVPGPGPGATPPASAQDAEHVDWVADDAVCRCQAGNGCWHYLKAPSEAPDDPCWCGYCEKVGRHDGTRSMPPGWSPTCASNGKSDCFLHRHALSWNIVCSDRFSRRKCCNLDHWENCPRCEKDEPIWRKEDQDVIAQRLEREIEVFGSKDVVICWSTHFYVVTDIPSLKIPVKGGSARVVGTHELAHIYAERAEKTWRDFVRVFGERVQISKPVGIFLPKRETTASKIQEKYIGSARTNLLYGGNNESRIANGFCFNGFCNSLQKAGSDDDMLHHTVRHMIGKLMMSCWLKVDPNVRSLPPWLFEGTGHWIAKMHPRLRDLVVWCANEGTAISGSGKTWEAEARKIAGSPKTKPIQVLLDKAAVGLMDYDDHVRAWSFLELGLSEDRERMVNVLAGLRNQTSTREAWMAAMGCTPEEWEQRWKDRLLGRRPTLGEIARRDDTDEDGPGGAERRAIRLEQDLQVLASRVRSIGTCSEPKLARVLVAQFARDSDAVREALTVVLSRTTDPATLAAIRETGFPHPHPMVRAYTARVLGFARDKDAGEGAKALCADAYWLARAEAALCLMRIGDAGTVATVAPLLDDASAKVRIAAMDALGSRGAEAERVVSKIAGNLNHGAWQVRSTAADALGGIGSMSAVDPLIKRAVTEAGRIRKDAVKSLELITREVGLGLNPDNWAKWWSRQREAAGGGIPDRPAEMGPEPPSIDEQRYGVQKPPDYGLRVFSDRVGYVLDMSNSMFQMFEPDEAAVKRFRRVYKGATKFDISKEEITQSVESLDPRARFNVMVFSDRPRSMSKTLLPATPDNRGKAASFMRGARSAPGGGGGASQLSDFYRAFREVFDLPDGALPDDLRETPDTMFFLTDGEPTIGEIIDPDSLLAWFNGLNRYARIRVHVVCYGSSADLPFLSHLAEDNGGEFIHIREAKPADDAPVPGSK